LGRGEKIKEKEGEMEPRVPGGGGGLLIDVGGGDVDPGRWQ
jgi:hypothetical protein